MVDWYIVNLRYTQAILPGNHTLENVQTHTHKVSQLTLGPICVFSYQPRMAMHTVSIASCSIKYTAWNQSIPSADNLDANRTSTSWQQITLYNSHILEEEQKQNDTQNQWPTSMQSNQRSVVVELWVLSPPAWQIVLGQLRVHQFVTHNLVPSGDLT